MEGEDDRHRSHHPHIAHRSGGRGRYRVYIISISTSRYRLKAKGESYRDESGDLAEELLRSNGHEIAGRDLIPDDLVMIRSRVMEAVSREDVDVVVTTGGTGISRTDTTIEAVRPLLDKELEGFGEVFRIESLREIGYSAIMSRATAGVIGDKLVVCLPGSPNAVRLGLKIVLPELDHIMNLVAGPPKP